MSQRSMDDWEFIIPGVGEMEIFNLSLLGKWRWRMITEKESEWNKLLDRLYGNKGVLNDRQYSVQEGY